MAAATLASGLPSILAADTINGITYTWGIVIDSVESNGEVILVNFSEPITAYTMVIEFSNSTVNPQIAFGNSNTPGHFTQVTWLNPTTVQVIGENPMLFNTPIYPGLDTGPNTFPVSIGWERNGGLYDLYFTSLTGPSSTQTPEPATIYLAALTLPALLLARRWSMYRNNKRAASIGYARAEMGSYRACRGARDRRRGFGFPIKRDRRIDCSIDRYTGVV